MGTIKNIFQELLCDWERNEIYLWQNNSVEMEEDYKSIMERKAEFESRFEAAIQSLGR